jgi:hypothetical protein
MLLFLSMSPPPSPLHAVCMTSGPRNTRWTGWGSVLKLEPAGGRGRCVLQVVQVELLARTLIASPAALHADRSLY